MMLFHQSSEFSNLADDFPVRQLPRFELVRLKCSKFKSEAKLP